MPSYRALKYLAVVMAVIIVVLVAANLLVENGTISSPRHQRELQQTKTALGTAVMNADNLGLAVGDGVTGDQWILAVSDLELTSTIVLSSNSEMRLANGRWLILYVRAENLASDARTISPQAVYLEDAQGVRYWPDGDSDRYNQEYGLDANDVLCQPGDAVSFGLVFDVPIPSSGLRLRYFPRP